MLFKYQGVQLYPDLSMHATLLLEGLMVMFSLTYPPWHSIKENNLKIFIAEFSEFNSKFSYL